MNSSKIITKTPGKLMLAGEWSILEPGNRCIVMAVDRFLTATVGPSSKTIIHLPNLGITIHSLTHEQKIIDPRTTYCTTAINTALRFLQESDITPQPFSLRITSNISTIQLPSGKQAKPGLGSSAATVVATITSILAYHNQETTNQQAQEKIFKLAVIAHSLVQEACGSGFDIAAATFGTTLVYQRFNQDWLTNTLKKAHTLVQLATTPWPGLFIKPLKLPAHLFVAVGFVGTSASTPNLIVSIKQNAKNFHVICTDINNVVLELENAINTANYTNIMALIKENRSLLQKLSTTTGVILETPPLKKLIQIAEALGAAAKFSGAGGGDCGIAVCNDKQTVLAIKKKWQDFNILPLDIEIL